MVMSNKVVYGATTGSRPYMELGIYRGILNVGAGLRARPIIVYNKTFCAPFCFSVFVTIFNSSWRKNDNKKV